MQAFDRFAWLMGGTFDNFIEPKDGRFELHKIPGALINKHSKTSFEKNCFSAWASTLNMGLIRKVDMVCLSPVGYGV